MTEPIPIDPQLRIGRLANGFTYYLRKSTNPKNKVYMSLVVKAGALHEERDELEVAHWLEHVVLRGTTHYPDGMLDYLEAKGLKRGTDTQAYAQFEFTRYQIDNIQGHDHALLKDALRILRDLTTEAIFDSVSMISEAGAVVAEGLLAGYENDLGDAVIARLLNNSYYGMRIGEPAKKHIHEFDTVALKRFYKKWYRPDLEGIIVVGDTDLDLLESEIMQCFGNLKKPDTPVRISPAIAQIPALNGKIQFIPVVHKDMRDFRIELYFKSVPHNRLETFQDYQTFIAGKLFSEMIMRRVQDIINHTNLPVKFAAAKYHDIANTKFIDGIEAYTEVEKVQDIRTGFQFLFTELERVYRYGFLATELERAKEALLREYSPGKLDHSFAIFHSCLRHFTSQSAAPSPDFKSQMIRRLLSSITPDEINKNARRWIRSKNRDIVIQGPAIQEAMLPDEKTIDRWIREVHDSTIAGYSVRSFNENQLVPKTDAPAGEIKKLSESPAIGITTYRLSNGIKLLLAPSKIQNDRIVVWGIAPGGASLYKGKDYNAARFAVPVVRNSGIAGVDPFDLNNYLGSKGIKVMPLMDDAFSHIRASCATAGFEKLLQVIHQYFMSPNTRQSGLDAFARKKAKEVAEKTFSFQDSIDIFLTGAPGDEVSLEDLREIDLNKVFDVYRERFTLNAVNFTFVVAGDFNSEEVLPVLNKYLGSLPSTGEPSDDEVISGAPLTRTFVPRKIDKAFQSPVPMKGTQVQLMFSGVASTDAVNYVRSLALEGLLNIRLLHRLREIEGGVYTANTSVNLSPSGIYTFQIRFHCNTKERARVDKLTAAVLEEISLLKRKGPDHDTFSRMHAQLASLLRSKFHGDRLAEYVVEQFRKHRKLEEIMEWLTILDQLTREDMRDAAGDFLKDESMIRFILS